MDESIDRVLSSLANRFPLLAQQHAQATHQPSPQQTELEAFPSRLRKPVKITGFPVRRPREIRERQVRKHKFYSNIPVILSLKFLTAEPYKRTYDMLVGEWLLQLRGLWPRDCWIRSSLERWQVQRLLHRRLFPNQYTRRTKDSLEYFCCAGVCSKLRWFL